MKVEEPGVCEDVTCGEARLWYAMSAPYRRERIACDRFEEAGFECFLPLRATLCKKRDGKTEVRETPLVPNLIFVRAGRQELQKAKQKVGVAQYLTRREGERNVPITVPDRQMANFRMAVEKADTKTIYLHPSEVDLRKGTRVRIVGGMLDGLEGVFMKVKGARSRRLVVMLEGITALAAEVEPDYIQIVTDGPAPSVI